MLYAKVKELEAARDAALQSKQSAVARALQAAEAKSAAEMRTYQQNNLTAFDSLKKTCQAAEAAKEMVR